MKILFLATDAFGGHGGIAAYNRCLAQALAEMPEVEEVALLSRVMRFPPSGVPSKVRLVQAAVGGKARFVLAALKATRQPADVVICSHIHLLGLAVILASALGARLVLQVYGIEAWEPARPLCRSWLARANAIWSISALTRDRMVSWSGTPLSRFTIIPPTFQAELFGVGERRPDLVARFGLKDRKVLMTLARLAGYDRYKGIDEILEILPGLLEIEPTLTYLVVGDGDDGRRLLTKAQALGVAAGVVFAGFVDESEKPDYYRLADVFALPGRGEGFGIVFLEAMACGVPVVGSLVDGSREALRNGQLGDLVDPANPVALRDAILGAITKGHRIPPGLDYFDWEHFQERVHAAVRDLTACSVR